MTETNASNAALLSVATRSQFHVKLSEFVIGLRANYASLTLAQPEDQLKAPVGEIAVAAGQATNTQILYRTETKVSGIAGRPDLGIDVAGLPAGNIELKAPGNGAVPSRFSDKRSRDQWGRFQALPNLIYTDGRHWGLYRYGTLIGDTVDIGVDVDGTSGDVAVPDSDKLLSLLTEFLRWTPIVPSSPKALAQMLAPVARLLRDEVVADIREGGILKGLANEWRATLFPDASDAEFADGYAQTFTYALLLARLEGAQPPLKSDTAAAELDADHALLAQALRVIGQHDVREAISMPVGLLERLIGAVNAARLSKKSDPWLYFYEDFLTAYDPVQRNNRGVYYTPLEVVGFQVRTAHALLRDKLGKPAGFGEHDVIVLDPAGGTGTYPLTVVSHTVAEATAAGGKGLGAEVATRLGTNLNAFEILVGPYAVTHLRLSRALTDAGGTLPADGVHVFLTDSLAEPAIEGFAKEVNIFQRKLAEEQERASKIKSPATKVTVVIGNPPWDRDSSGYDTTGRRKGGMVRYDSDGNIGLMKDFIEPLPAEVRGKYGMSLYNDYVYFWRWALWKACEQANGPAIVSFITASSFLAGPGFAAMREQMRRAFDEIWIVDLGGEGRGPRKDDNVFDGVLTPNAIAIGVRYDTPVNDDEVAPAVVRFRRVLGSKADKLAFLETHSELTEDDEWTESSTEWGASFVPAGTSSYALWPSLEDILPWTGRGIQFSRSWPIGESKDVLEARWAQLVQEKVGQRGVLLKESRDAAVNKSYKSFLTGRKLIELNKLCASDTPDAYERIAFRSFDRQWAVADSRVIDMPRPALWNTLGSKQIFLTSALDGTTAGPTTVANAYVPDLNSTNNRGGTVFPLYRDAAGTEANISSALLDLLSDRLGRNLSAEEVIGYIYGLTGTAAFVEQFKEQLRQDGVRIPFTADADLFAKVAVLGADLLWWATYAERSISVPGAVTHGAKIPAGTAKAETAVQPVGASYPEEFIYSPDTKTLAVGSGVVGPISPEVWAFEVSGLPVISSWLGYRMKKRAGRSSSPLDKIRPATWSFTGELLDVIAVVERLVNAEAEAAALLSLVLESPLVSTEELPEASAAERTAPASATPPDDATMFELKH